MSAAPNERVVEVLTSLDADEEQLETAERIAKPQDIECALFWLDTAILLEQLARADIRRRMRYLELEFGFGVDD